VNPSAEVSTMTTLRSLLAIGALLVLSAGTASAQAMKVTCKDGTRSAGGQGACSSHGGIAVAKTATKAAKADAKALKSAAKADAKAAKAVAKTELEDRDPKGAIAMCKDKTYSHAKSRQGICSAHGGVAKFMDGK
jgi:uncharacterized protein YgiM (DUF1202 family)